MSILVLVLLAHTAGATFIWSFPSSYPASFEAVPMLPLTQDGEVVNEQQTRGVCLAVRRERKRVIRRYMNAGLPAKDSEQGLHCS